MDKIGKLNDEFIFGKYICCKNDEMLKLVADFMKSLQDKNGIKKFKE